MTINPYDFIEKCFPTQADMADDRAYAICHLCGAMVPKWDYEFDFLLPVSPFQHVPRPIMLHVGFHTILAEVLESNG